MFVFVALLAFVASAELSEECQYVKTTRYMYDAAKIKACFESYQISQDFIDAIIRNLEVIGDIYPYVDIAKNPPKDMERRNPVNFEEKLEELKQTLSNSTRVIADVFRPTMKFIDSLHDGHFGMSTTVNMTDNLFVGVSGYFPFVWEVLPDENGQFHVYIFAREPDFFLDPDVHAKIVQKETDNVIIEKVDDVDAFTFFAEFFGEYNMMKSIQGSLMFSLRQSLEGFDILKNPLETLFDQHTLYFSDNDTFTFNLGFINQNVPNRKRDGFKLEDPLTFVTMKDEKDALERFKDTVFAKRSSTVKRAPTGVIECGYNNSMNYLVISSFSADINAFVDEITDCIRIFDKNEDPITVYLPMNRGGYLALEAITFNLLFPDSDPSTLFAIRKTDKNEFISVDKGYAMSLSPNEDYCYMFNSLGVKELEKFWSVTETDDLGGGVLHSRTKKENMLYKELLVQFQNYVLTNPRKPTDVVVVTEGFCFSACSVFVDNVIRTGVAIVTGIGATHPGNERFVAAQCPSTVINPADYFDSVKNNTAMGIGFSVTFFESYNISAKKDEVIPGDYETMRIDKHLGYYEVLDPDIMDIIEYTKDVHEEFKEKCNPYNQRLLLVNDKCKVSDKHALTVGYACGSDGFWNHSDCRIATCKMQYAVDFKNNKCMVNDCDPRYPFPQNPSPSSSSITRPLFGVISFILLGVFQRFVH